MEAENEKEIWERLTKVEQSAKSAHHRIDTLDKLTESVHIIATETKAMREDVNDITERVDEIEKKPNKRYETTETLTACTDNERDELLKRYPTATVTTVDNTGYEWLDGMQFTQEQLADGELERAVEMGEIAYNEMKNAPSQDEINAMLLLKIAEMEVAITNEQTTN